ncbi:MAG: tetratricopeptide repeat protein [Alphaproteobacteria bacterium]|nr:tetratricopeptide repeat protein [Alphaproteobacteria bacterium]MBL6937390.1 tetratricopeptide repeat protein [Alphaproteobacteria bacterium]MBL7096048.1 tetratricopeptide repeat protein [Alphaproteobacteria bacterium]
MNIRVLSAAAVCAAFFVTPADAAVTVIGPGPAAICYQAAEIGASPADYMTYCDQALAGMLTNDDRAATFVNRGVLRLSLNDFDAAAADFRSGLALNGSLGEGYVDLGAVQIAHRQYAEAIADINKGLKLGTKKPYLAYYDRAMASEALGNLQGAYDDYRQALQLEPDFTKASDELKRFKIVDKPGGA